MNERARHEWVTRYLQGSLSADDHLHFDAMLNRDATLRRMLDAERLIRDSIDHDRGAIAGDHAVTRSRVFASLAALPAPHAAVVGGGTAAIGGVARIIRMLLVGTVGAGLLAGGYVMINDVQEPAPHTGVRAGSVAKAHADAPQPSVEDVQRAPARESIVDGERAADPVSETRPSPSTDAATSPNELKAHEQRRTWSLDDGHGTVGKPSRTSTRTHDASASERSQASIPNTRPASSPASAAQPTAPAESEHSRSPMRVIRKSDVSVEVHID